MIRLAARDPRFRSSIAGILNATKWGDAEAVLEAKRSHNAVRVQLALERELARTPPISDEQRVRLMALLASGVPTPGRADDGGVANA